MAQTKHPTALQIEDDRTFCRVIEKRVRKDASREEWFRKGDTLLIKDGLCRAIVRGIIGDHPVRLTSRKPSKAAYKEVMLTTLDDESNQFLAAILTGEKKGRKQASSSYPMIPLLISVTDGEAARYARVNGLPFTPRRKQPQVQAFIESLAGRYPETKHSLAKSIRAMQQILR